MHSFHALGEYLHSLVKLTVTRPNYFEVTVTSEDQRCDGDYSLQSRVQCSQIDIEVPLRSNWAKWNLLGREDQSCFGGDIEIVYDRGGMKTESSGSHFRCPKRACLASNYCSRKPRSS